jgi:hypothetical protein
LAKKISRIDRRFAAYARLKNKKSAGERYNTAKTKMTQQKHNSNTNNNNKNNTGGALSKF